MKITTEIKIDSTLECEEISGDIYIFKIPEFNIAGQGKTIEDCKRKADYLIKAFVSYSIDEMKKPTV
jgi:hypothetical protein